MQKERKQVVPRESLQLKNSEVAKQRGDNRHQEKELNKELVVL